MSANTWSDAGYREWQGAPPIAGPDATTRAVVLGGGGATGIAWLSGVIAGLRDLGVDPGIADTIIGTSAGSVVGTQLRLDRSKEETDTFLAGFLDHEPLNGLGRIGPNEAFAFVRGALHPDGGSGRRLVGSISTRARTGDEESFIDLVAGDLRDQPWPAAHLLITAIDVDNGAPVVFHRDSDVPLDRAVAASCSVPGVFPSIRINDRRYMDGGVRSVANVDLAAGHDRVLVLAPIPYSFGRRANPAQQARALWARSRTLTVTPDLATQRAVGLNFLDVRRTRPAYEAGRAQAQRISERVIKLWHD